MTPLDWNQVLLRANGGNPSPERRITKTDTEWREQLSDAQFHVTRQQGTERAFSSDSCTRFEPGAYQCVCCKTELFDSKEKFDSGTGWPSFTGPTADNAIAYHQDGALGMSRVEVTCSTCDAHLGHVFPDGPGESGLRYCVNAAALEKSVG